MPEVSDWSTTAAGNANVAGLEWTANTERNQLAPQMREMMAQVARWRDRLVNIHPSLLPAYPGLHTHERALADGVRLHGCTVHFVTAALDHGPVVIQAAVPVLDDDTPDTLAARVLAQEHRIYPQAVRWFVEGQLSLDGVRVRLAAPQQDTLALISPTVR